MIFCIHLFTQLLNKEIEQNIQKKFKQLNIVIYAYYFSNLKSSEKKVPTLFIKKRTSIAFERKKKMELGYKSFKFYWSFFHTDSFFILSG